MNNPNQNSKKMKQRIYLLAFLLVYLSLGACDDVYEHVADPPQSYEQEAEQSVEGFNIVLAEGLTSPVLITDKQLAEATRLVAVRAAATPELSEGAEITFRLELSHSDSFEKSMELSCESSENSASISSIDLNEAVKSLYGKAPEARALYLKTKYYITDGTSSVLMPSEAILGPITVTPAGPIIESAYYLIGDINGWDFANIANYQFSHSGKDVYEDPIFTLLVNNVSGNFKIAPQSNKETSSWEGVLGTAIDEDTSLSGILEGNGAIRIEEFGWVKITLNMLEYTYSIEIIGEMSLTLYVPGSHQGWNPTEAPTLYSRNFDFKYDGFVYFDGPHQFKFTSEPSWNGTNYGYGGDGILSIDGGAGNVEISDAGFYQVTVDLSGSPYTYALVKTDWGLIGDATEGGWDQSSPMIYHPETGLWDITTTLAGGKSFKFRANNGWDINLGGNLSNLTYGGDNIPVAEDGSYHISLDLSDPMAYKCTVVKQ